MTKVTGMEDLADEQEPQMIPSIQTIRSITETARTLFEYGRVR